MDLAQDNRETLDVVEDILKKNDNNKFKCSSKKIFFIILGCILLIGLCVLIIYLAFKNKENKNKKEDKIENYIYKLFNNYLKDLTKIAITPNRIQHLIKTDSEDKYQNLVDLEKIILNSSWEKINLKKNESINDLDKLISKFLFPNDTEIHYGIFEDLNKILTQEEEKINKLLEKETINILNQKLKNNEDIKEKELIENKLKSVILYTLINFPLQITYYSKNPEIKQDLINTVVEKLNPNEISNKINEKMEKYDNNIYNLYMVLGSDQGEERKRINTKVKNFNFVNFINTGLRIQSTQNEIDNFFKKSFEEYYLNKTYKELMKACSADGIMSEENYTKFIETCQSLINEKYTKENMVKINEIFNYYTFSVETANTIIEYINLNVPLEKIHIIRLGQNYRNKLTNEELKYDENDIYILYNVYDISKSSDGTKRATTVSNVKAIYYLKEEFPNFLKEDDYNKLILVSSQGTAERQLEAFNIISNISNIDNYQIKFDAVIWNNNYSKNLNGKDVISCMLDSFVKSTNLISTSFFTFNKFQDNIKYFIESVLNLTEEYK